MERRERGGVPSTFSVRIYGHGHSWYDEDNDDTDDAVCALLVVVDGVDRGRFQRSPVGPR